MTALASDRTLAGLRAMTVEQIDAALSRLVREQKSATDPTRLVVLARVIDTALGERWMRMQADGLGNQ
ncbi:MAG: hypothetical protein PGN07_04740 [Aeromicrobium erythreum]